MKARIRDFRQDAKALAAGAVAAIAIANQIWGLGIEIDPDHITALSLAIIPALVWLVPNREPRS